jgi:hypothetical protein
MRAISMMRAHALAIAALAEVLRLDLWLQVGRVMARFAIFTRIKFF